MLTMFWLRRGVFLVAMLSACGNSEGFYASCCSGPQQFGAAEQSALPGEFRKIRRKTNIGSIRIPSRFLHESCMGRIRISLDGDTALSRLQVMGSSNVPMIKIKLEPECEAFVGRKLRIVNTQPGSTLASAESDDMVDMITVTYPTRTGTRSDNFFLVNGSADISSLDIYAPSQQVTVISVMVMLMEASWVSGRTTAETVRLGFDFGTAEDSNFEMYGYSSGLSVTRADQVSPGYGFTNNTVAKAADIVGWPMTIVKTKPTVTLASDSPSGASVPGLNDALRFTVAADAASELTLSRMTFRVVTADNGVRNWDKAVSSTSTGGSNRFGADSFKVYDRSDLSYPIQGRCTLWGEDGKSFASLTKVGYVRCEPASPIYIASGLAKTFVVKVDTSGASAADDDSFRLDVAEDTSPVYVAGGDGSVAGQNRGSSFVWGEMGINAVSNLTGFLVRNLPVHGGTIIY